MDRPDRKLPSAGGARSGILAMLALVVVLLALPAAAQARRIFGPAGAAPITTERLFDLGAVDYDGDGLLDAFTTNHKFHSSLLHNDGGGNFSDVTGPSGVSPSPEFPGYEKLRPPVMTRPGIYVYATDAKREKLPGQVHITAVGAATRGSMSFGSDAAVILRANGATTEQTRTSSGQPMISFSIEPGGRVDLQPQNLDLPISASFSDPSSPASSSDPSSRSSLVPPVIPGLPPPTDPTQTPTPSEPTPSSRPPAPPIFVGTDAVQAPNDFILNLHDRHGFTFADVAGDNSIDLFAVSGGLGGRIKLGDYVTKVQDELLVQGGSRFDNRSAGSGLAKGGCRARQSAAVDVDSDGQLDLFESCEGDPPEIYKQLSRGDFTNLPSPPKSIASRYRWVDLGGPRPSLLAAERKGTVVRSYTSKGWKVKQRIRDNARKGQISQYALDDFDNDGSIDVLAVARTGNTLLRNVGGKLRPVPLKGTGIPSKSVAASFVDYDNDGRIDLDLVPQGLYRGVGVARFKKTGKLTTRSAGGGITSWPDYDNDGLRDPVIASGNAEFAKRMKVVRAHNLGPGGHWLEINLIAHNGNREAIGGRIKIMSGGRPMYGWVGESEDSHHSQGHYRVYFGLGKHKQVGGMVVSWPDGSKTRFEGFRADRVMDINQP